MQKPGCFLPSVLVLFLTLASSAHATQVLSVTDKKVEIRVTGELPVYHDQLYYLLDNGRIRRGIVKIENVIDDVAFGELLMGTAEPDMKLEPRSRKSARRNHGSRTPASVSSDESGDTRSDYFWTPREGFYSITGSYAMLSGSFDVASNGSTLNVSEQHSRFGFQALYSFTPRFTVGLGWNFSNSQSLKYTVGSGSTTLTSGGAADPVLGALYQTQDNDATYFFGLQTNVSLGPYKPPGLNSSGNVASGGIGITPYAGLLVRAADHYFGTRVHYTYLLPRTVQPSTGSSYQLTGGNSIGLEIFYEYHFDEYLISPIIGFDSYSSTTSSDPDDSPDEAYTIPHWDLKFVYKLSPDFQISAIILSRQRYFPAGDSNSAIIEQMYGGQVNARYEF